MKIYENSNPYKNSYLDANGNIYKVEELKEVNGQRIVAKTTYTNTTGKLPDVAYYIVTLSEDGKTKIEEFLDENEKSVDISEQDKEIFKVKFYKIIRWCFDYDNKWNKFKRTFKFKFNNS